MASKNPILSRYEQAQQPGFAYDEGRSAYAAASGGSASAEPVAPAASTATTAPTATPPAGTRAQFDLITAGGGARVTMADVIVKTALLFAVAVVTAVIGWNVTGAAPSTSGAILIVAMLAMLGLGLVNSFKKRPSPVLILLYGVATGFMLGSISYVYNELALANEYPGIVLQAVVATMTAFGVMLALYATGVIKVTRKFASIMIVAMVSYLVLGLASLVAALFGVGGGWGFYGVGGLGIAIAVIGVLLASFSLLLDFEAIKQGIALGLPERESWRMAFGLMVTLVWLYLEILRLLAIISGRD